MGLYHPFREHQEIRARVTGFNLAVKSRPGFSGEPNCFRPSRNGGKEWTAPSGFPGQRSKKFRPRDEGHPLLHEGASKNASKSPHPCKELARSCSTGRIPSSRCLRDNAHNKRYNQGLCRGFTGSDKAGFGEPFCSTQPERESGERNGKGLLGGTIRQSEWGTFVHFSKEHHSD